MFELKKKNLIYFTLAAVFVLFLSGLIPLIRKPILNQLKYPLNLLALVRREAGAIIFYHRNFSENESLKREMGLLKRKLIATEEAYLENKRLRDTLSLKNKSSYRVVIARVIGRGADNWFSEIIIDKGSYQRIKRGCVVIAYLGLVGQVVETTDNTSRVLLINDPALAVSAVVQRSRQEGLASGTLGNYLLMKYLPKDADIEASDIIITSGLTGNYPKGLVIGSVIDIGEEFSGLSRYAIIKPAANLSNLEEVLVIIP